MTLRATVLVPFKLFLSSRVFQRVRVCIGYNSAAAATHSPMPSPTPTCSRSNISVFLTRILPSRFLSYAVTPLSPGRILRALWDP